MYLAAIALFIFALVYIHGIRVKTAKSHQEFVKRTGELMAETFLRGLKPASLIRPPHDLGCDLLVAFNNSRVGTNTFGVVVEATEHFVPPSFVFDLNT